MLPAVPPSATGGQCLATHRLPPPGCIFREGSGSDGSDGSRSRESRQRGKGSTSAWMTSEQLTPTNTPAGQRPDQTLKTQLGANLALR